LLSVKVKRLVPPTGIGFVAKAFDMVGTDGSAQPRSVILSRITWEVGVGGLLFRPTKITRKVVWAAPVVTAVIGPRVVQFLEMEVAEKACTYPLPSFENT